MYICQYRNKSNNCGRKVNSAIANRTDAISLDHHQILIVNFATARFLATNIKQVTRVEKSFLILTKMEGEKSKDGHISIKLTSDVLVSEEYLDVDESDIGGEQSDWQSIIFLPFEPYWIYIIVLTTIFNFGMNSMDFVFELKDTVVHTFLYYLFEIFYLIHTVAQLIHK